MPPAPPGTRRMAVGEGAGTLAWGRIEAAPGRPTSDSPLNPGASRLLGNAAHNRGC